MHSPMSPLPLPLPNPALRFNHTDLPVHLAVLPLPRVPVAVCVQQRAKALDAAIHPVTWGGSGGGTSGMQGCAWTFQRSSNTALTLVHVAVSVHGLALALNAVVHPLALKPTAIQVMVDAKPDIRGGRG